MQVAASRYVPTNSNTNTSPKTSNSNDLAPQNASHPGSTTVAGGAVKAVTEQNGVESPPVILAKRAPVAEEPASKAQLPQFITNSAGDSPSVEMPAKPSAADDTSTQVSSSGSSAKMVSFDKQSIASGATFGMDEEESLRPDDSASIRVIEEEDGCGTGATGSRVGSDTDARAFSEQLHQIAVMTPRGILQQNKTMRPNITFGEMPMDPIPQAPLMVLNQVAPTLPPPDAPTPDEKLLDALDSPRDRVYVLKIEQDFIDFLKNEKDTQLVLPETNAFYRLLAHKLADYYGLDHEVTNSSTGSAVVIAKSTHFKLSDLPLSLESTKLTLSSPPPLSGLSQPGTTASTPPPAIPARKIMRRGGEGKGMVTISSTFDYQRHPNTATETGGDGNSDNGTGTPGGSKNKTALTREEREKQYAEARLRIFGNMSPDAVDANKEPGDIDNSRSSSAAGKQKNKNKSKRQNSDSDDDFKPRSHYPGYYPQQQPQTYPAAGPQYEGPVFYPQYGTMAGSAPAYAMPQQSASPPLMYGPGFSSIDPSGQFAYPQPQQYQGSSNGMTIAGYGQPSSGAYDMSAHFQQGMQSFQNSMQASKVSSPSYTPPYQIPPQQAWQPVPQFEGGFQYPQQNFAPSFAPQRPVSTQSQPSTQPSYQYGQDPSQNFQNGNRTPRTQHPAPGSYMRPQFNPQTQAFVPGIGHGGQPPMMPMPSMNDVMVYRSMQPSTFNPTPRVSSGPLPGTLPHSTPSTSNPSAYSSPRNHHAMPHMPGDQQLAHPLPQPPTNPASSIAKWGTPAHLPAKPPPPQNDHPHKFIEINRGLPPHATIPGLPRTAFTGESK